MRGKPGVLAWSLCAFAGAVYVAGLVLRAGYGYFDDLGPLTILRVLLSALPISVPVVGALVAARRPRNPIGWLLLGAGVVVTVIGFGYLYGLYPTGASVGDVLPGQLVLVHVALALEAAPLVVLPFILLLFPHGRLPSRRWRPLAWVTGVAIAFPVAVTAASPGADFGPDESTVVSVAKYHGLGDGEWLGWLVYWSWQLSHVLLIVAALSLVVRMRGARGDARQQLKWAASGATIFAVHQYLVLDGLDAFLNQQDLHRVFYGIWEPYLLPVAVALVPVCFAVGILKYRLYDIDVVFSKALVYAALAGLVTVVYVAVVVGLGHALGTSTARPNLALWILATVVVALAFHPARERLQRVANRVVYGRRALPYDVLADFARLTSRALPVDEALPPMAEAIGRGLAAENTLVRVFLPGTPERVVTWSAGSGGNGFERTIPVLHRGQAVGEISVAKAPGDRMTPVDDRLLADLGAQAGTALWNMRLLVELQARLEEISAQAAELEASRRRVIAAQDAERRRLERDLHDGAQQELVSLAGRLRFLRKILAADAARAEALVGELVADADETLEGIRDLARGIFPQVLADRGLAPALRARLAKYARARLDCEQGVAGARFPAGVEAAVYFCCLEALQNVTKHAPSASVSVRLSLDDGHLRFSVADTGAGFDPAALTAGSGLDNMRDRLAALGGRLTLSTGGGGTTVAGAVPVPRGGAGDDRAWGAARQPVLLPSSDAPVAFPTTP